MRRPDLICPRCGRPIADQAYCCHLCAAELAQKLREAAAMWPSLEGAIGRQSRTSSGPGRAPAKATERHVLAGPWCWGGGRDCGHPSCYATWHSVAHQRIEPPLASEDPGLLNLGASEAGWVITNTVTTWARHVEEERGIPIPVARPARKIIGAGAVADPHDTDRPNRCHWSDLPVGQCACGRHPKEES